MPKLLNDNIAQQVGNLFKDRLRQPVEVLFFGKSSDCDYCTETQQLVEEVSALSDKLHLSLYDVEKDPELARQYHVDKTPMLALAGSDHGALTDYGIRFAGVPSGHEFASLIHSLILVSGRDSGLQPETRAFLKTLSQPVHLQVFVTPT